MYQQTTIVGNLGRDPEMRYMPNGTAVTSFSVATSNRWTDQATGQLKEETCWFRVSVWGRQAENCNQYLAKGRQVLVTGRLRPDPNTGGPQVFTRRDGTVGASFEITATDVKFLSSSGKQGNGYESGHDAGELTYVDEEDEIPF